MSETHLIERGPDRRAVRSIELVYSPGGWYAQEWDFRRAHGHRLSLGLYRSKANLIRSLDRGTHRWEKWS